MNENRQLPLRSEIKKEDQWRMEDLYGSDKEWETDYLRIWKKFQKAEQMHGKIKESARMCREILDWKQDTELMLERLYVYANQKWHEDMGNARYQQMAGKASDLSSAAEDVLSFVEPELMDLDEETLHRYFQAEPGLELYRRYIHELQRNREHILSKEMEQVLARASSMGQGPENIYSMFNNADLHFGEIRDTEGKPLEITHGTFVRLLENEDRRVRRDAFCKVYQAYAKFGNTLAAVFEANVKQVRFFSSMRRYDSAREAALDVSRIPVPVYDNLIEMVHEALPLMYRYVDLRRRALGLDEIHMYDVYVPLAREQKREIPFAKAKEMVREGLAPLGEEYLHRLDKGFAGGWIDVYENKGKKSGAYSWGAYGTHPYVLLNYNGSLNHVFTLAHEMGHALHSDYADEAQPYLYAGYRIFVAEVASTCNEALLIHHLLEKARDREERAYLINYFLDQCKGTIFRQTMFAEFEHLVHEKSAGGEALTAQVLYQTYYELNRKYFGPLMICDEEIGWEWARIPHFYTPFYVYQYATGFSAAIAISRKILAGEPGIVEKYKQFLGGGSSMDCLDLLKICGVDMTEGKPVQMAMKTFEEYLDELEQLL